ncbi:MAG: penicillin acylase family protein [Phycisphaerae bacterium]|nr:penicillin acylase family protein [Gemmatimonadaceae bacterium]
MPSLNATILSRFGCRIVAGLFVLSVATTGTAQSAVLDTLAHSSLAQLSGNLALSGLREPVEVVRDRFGVPHIYARNIDDLFFAQGFVQAQDRLWQMEMYRRTFEGTLSEIMGPSYVAHDKLSRLLKFRGPFDDKEWKSYHPEGRRIFDAFAAGVNAFIVNAGDKLPVEFRLTGIKPQKWTADVALLRTQTALPTADAIAELRLAQSVARLGVDSANRVANPSPFRPLVAPVGVDLSIINPDVIAALSGLRTGVARPPLLPQFSALRDALPSANFGVQENSPGSNNWVVSGARTVSGHVIVANDPHRNVANPSIRYIVHLNAPGWNVIGATEPVLPGVMIGHTERIGWGLTIVGTDQADVYVEDINPARRTETRFRGAWEPMRSIKDTIRVKDGAPTIVTHHFTRHGPVFYTDTTRNKAYVMRSTAHMPGSAGYLSALRYHAIADCQQFLDAQQYFLAPTENMICGDTRGNIAWQASAASPNRPNWHGRLPVSGNGDFEWNGLRTQLPREFNPARGWIATANHDIHPEGFDPPLFFKNGPAGDRYDRIESVFSEARKFTMQDMAALQHDAYSLQGTRDVALFQGWSSRDARVENGRAALAAWNGQSRRESMAAALYRYAARSITRDVRSTALTAAQKQPALERAIANGLDSLTATQGADASAWRWGRINRSELPHPLVKAFDIPAVERHGGAGFVAAVGATYREIIDMGDLDGAMATNVPGQSGQPGSPFYSNLVDGFGKGEYFQLAFSKAAVDKAAAHRLMLVPRNR